LLRIAFDIIANRDCHHQLLRLITVRLTLCKDQHIFVYILLFCFQNQHHSIHCTTILSLKRSCQILAKLLCFCLRTQGSSIELTKHNLCTSSFRRNQRSISLPFAVTHILGQLANLNPILELKMANCCFLPLGARKSINCCRSFRYVEWQPLVPLPLLPFAGSAPPAHRALHINLVTYAHNLVYELKYFVICCSIDY
jgi:hypothetical protein